MNKINNDKGGLSEGIYQELRKRLIVGDFAPNDALSIRKLAEEFDVSAMPVREALKRLESESLLWGSAKRAYRVPDISVDEASSIFFVRATLEGAGAELAVDFLTGADLKQLRRFATEMDEYWQDLDAGGFLNSNFRFHSLIYRSTRNATLSEIAETLYARCGPWLGRAIRELASAEDWATEHHDIVDAFEARDRRRVRALVEADVNWGASYFRNAGKAAGGQG